VVGGIDGFVFLQILSAYVHPPMVGKALTCLAGATRWRLGIGLCRWIVVHSSSLGWTCAWNGLPVGVVSQEESISRG
jgi:hypothetical protein